VDHDRDPDRGRAALRRVGQALGRLLEPALAGPKAGIHLEQAEMRGHGAALATGGSGHAGFLAAFGRLHLARCPGSPTSFRRRPARRSGKAADYRVALGYY
jgi:hypothetical protein